MARFMRRGVTRIYWCTAAKITNPMAPTSDMFIGTGAYRLDQDVAEMSGFTWSAEPIDIPDMSSTFTSKIPGGDVVENSNVVFYEDLASNALKTTLAKNNGLGFFVIFPRGISGPTPGNNDICEIWPCAIGSNSRRYTASNEAAKFEVVFTPLMPPVIDVPVPGATGSGSFGWWSTNHGWWSTDVGFWSS